MTPTEFAKYQQHVSDQLTKLFLRDITQLETRIQELRSQGKYFESFVMTHRLRPLQEKRAQINRILAIDNLPPI